MHLAAGAQDGALNLDALCSRVTLGQLGELSTDQQRFHANVPHPSSQLTEFPHALVFPRIDAKPILVARKQLPVVAILVVRVDVEVREPPERRSLLETVGGAWDGAAVRALEDATGRVPL